MTIKSRILMSVAAFALAGASPALAQSDMPMHGMKHMHHHGSAGAPPSTRGSRRASLNSPRLRPVSWRASETQDIRTQRFH